MRSEFGVRTSECRVRNGEGEGVPRSADQKTATRTRSTAASIREYVRVLSDVPRGMLGNSRSRDAGTDRSAGSPAEARTVTEADGNRAHRAARCHSALEPSCTPNSPNSELRVPTHSEFRIPNSELRSHPVGGFSRSSSSRSSLRHSLFTLTCRSRNTRAPKKRSSSCACAGPDALDHVARAAHDDRPSATRARRGSCR